MLIKTFILLCFGVSSAVAQPKPDAGIIGRAAEVVKKQVLADAEKALSMQPVTVTAVTSPLSAGGIHDFFSQADYFWPNPANPAGPYINRDGETNPDNFVAHRKAMIRLSTIIGSLASAYQLTHDDKYVRQAVKHLNAWFVDPKTMMNPDLQFSQAVIGQSTGRNWGIIDGIHLMEVARGAKVMERSPAFNNASKNKMKAWFSAFIKWLNTSKFGILERDAKNNHSTCWVMQVAAFAQFTGDEHILDTLRTRYKTILLPGQMAANGSFPLELERTKPYGYSIFNLDAMATICQVLSTEKDNLWTFGLPDGRSVKKGIEYLYPFVADKSEWTLKPDVMYWNDWPVAQPFLLFGAARFSREDWFNTWEKLDHRPQVEEVIRNLPIRNPLLWYNL